MILLRQPSDDRRVCGSTGIVSEIRRRLEVAQLIIDFLGFMGVRGSIMLHEMQVFSVFNELVPLLRRAKEQAREELRRAVFLITP